jgi:acetyltransferase-like isoleucine patch superfamily enzyme
LLAGGVSVGNNTLIGMGVTVLVGVHIGNNVIINNGCKIIRDVPDNEVVKAT